MILTDPEEGLFFEFTLTKFIWPQNGENFEWMAKVADTGLAEGKIAPGCAK